MLNAYPRAQASAPVEDELRDALKASRGFFFYAAVFSLFINMLMLLPAIYMLQIYDRVLTSSSVSTLLALTFLVVILFAVMWLLEGMPADVMIKTGERTLLGYLAKPPTDRLATAFRDD